MKRFLAPALAVMLMLGIAVASAQVPPNESTSGVLAAKGDSVVLHCGSGQSVAVAYMAPTTGPTTFPTSTAMPTGTPMPTTAPTTTPFIGQVTISTSVGWQDKPLAWASPDAANAPGSTSYAVILPTPYPGKLYASLGGDHWIEAVLTSPDPNGFSNRAYLSCK